MAQGCTKRCPNILSRLYRISNILNNKSHLPINLTHSLFLSPTPPCEPENIDSVSRKIFSRLHNYFSVFIITYIQPDPIQKSLYRAQVGICIFMQLELTYQCLLSVWFTFSFHYGHTYRYFLIPLNKKNNSISLCAFPVALQQFSDFLLPMPYVSPSDYLLMSFSLQCIIKHTIGTTSGFAFSVSRV